MARRDADHLLDRDIELILAAGPDPMVACVVQTNQNVIRNDS